MNAAYLDIVSRIKEEPKWWDENGTPRYCEFHPSQLSDIYAEKCALIKIACQNCGQEFKVAYSQNRYSILNIIATNSGMEFHDLEELIKNGSLHYGDPPNTGCCSAGATMNCEDIEVLEYWYRDENCNWVRNTNLEISLQR